MLSEQEKHLENTCMRHLGEALSLLTTANRKKFIVDVGAAIDAKCGICGIQATFKVSQEVKPVAKVPVVPEVKKVSVMAEVKLPEVPKEVA